MFKVGLTTVPALEDFTPSQKSAANLLPDLFAKAQEEGRFTKDIIASIEKIFTRLTGLKYTLKVMEEANASMRVVVLPNMGGVNNIDTRGYNEAEANEAANWIIQHLGDTTPSKSFYYDQKTGMFGGKGIEKLDFEAMVGNGLLRELDAEEITAVMLHEVGHSVIMLRDLLTYFDQSLIMQSASLMLGNTTLEGKVQYDLVGAVLKRLDKKKHSRLYEKLSKGEYTKKDFVKACMLINDDIEITSFSLAGQGGINRRNEQAADYYAVRLGFGSALSTGLRKIGVEVFGTGSVLSASAMQALLISIFGASVAIITMMPAGIIYGIVSAMFLYAMSHEDMVSSYDMDGPRHKRIYRAMIEELKRGRNDNIPKDKMAILVKNLDEMEAYVENTWDDKGWFQFLNPFYVRNYLGRKQEERLEGLINNPLFLSATKLDL